MDIECTLPDADVEEVLVLLNAFLDHLSLMALSRREVGLADPHGRCFGVRDKRFSFIEKVINRWGIRSDDSKYYLRLNELIGRISSRNRMLCIYKPIQLLLFTKLLEAWPKRERPKYTIEEVRIFFLQPYKMIISL